MKTVKRHLLLVITTIILSACNKNTILPPTPVLPVPTEDQLTWHEMEMNAFIHFTTNTFTDLEWGYGDESPSIFNPSQLNTNQWITALKDAGFKGAILTTKHHDGFCLWPSAYTGHSVKNSPYKNGNGDVVREVSDACKKHGLKFGVYLSPWDRNRADYGQDSYIEYYRNQLGELLNNYGDIFEMWFDGANGGDGYYGGARQTRKIDNRTYYNWPKTIGIAKGMQPEVLFFSDGGPDIRWVGNEKGYVGETNWNTINIDTLYAGKSGINNILNTGSEDGTSWTPAEVDVSIRPGWFYHAKEDSLVKTPEQLFDIYLTSVGRGAVLLLNIPPDRRGLFNENDVNALKGFRKLLDDTFKNDLSRGAKISVTNYRGGLPIYDAKKINDDKKETYWATDDSVHNASVEFNFPAEQSVSYIILQEYIKLGQRVKSFSIELWDGEGWKEVFNGTTIGYKRIVKIPGLVKTSKLRVNIIDAKAAITMSNIEIY